MAEQANELKKLATIASDLGLSAPLRIKFIELFGNIATHDALLSLLDLAAKRELIKKEKDIALQDTREVIKSGR